MWWCLLGDSDFGLDVIHQFLFRTEHRTMMYSSYPLLLLNPLLYFSHIWKCVALVRMHCKI